MALSPRFAINTLGLVGGGFLAVSAMSFSAPVAGWIGFGVSTAIAVAALTGVVTAHRASAKAGHGLLALVAGWSLVAALVFSGTALTWLVLGNALAVAAAALGDLTAHELGTERVVHSLEITEPANGQAKSTLTGITA